MDGVEGRGRTPEVVVTVVVTGLAGVTMQLQADARMDLFV